MEGYQEYPGKADTEAIYIYIYIYVGGNEEEWWQLLMDSKGNMGN